LEKYKLKEGEMVLTDYLSEHQKEEYDEIEVSMLSAQQQPQAGIEELISWPETYGMKCSLTIARYGQA
jgi:hypothetical protein